MVRISGISSCPGFELSENSTPKPKGMEIWLVLAGIRVDYPGFNLLRLYCNPSRDPWDSQ